VAEIYRGKIFEKLFLSLCMYGKNGNMQENNMSLWYPFVPHALHFIVAR
jgi:hypothetical protein